MQTQAVRVTRRRLSGRGVGSTSEEEEERADHIEQSVCMDNKITLILQKIIEFGRHVSLI